MYGCLPARATRSTMRCVPEPRRHAAVAEDGECAARWRPPPVPRPRLRAGVAGVAGAAGTGHVSRNPPVRAAGFRCTGDCRRPSNGPGRARCDDGPAMKFLCVGDIHLGRRPSRLPEELPDELRASDLGPAAAWRRAVDFAIEAEADAVLLAGDVVEQEDDFYEAYGDLRDGAARLAAAGVRVLAVSGNHDVQVLPRLADAVPGFRLVGRGGRWEIEDVEGRGGGRAHVLGWSFPERRVSTSPLSAHPLPPPRSAVRTAPGPAPLRPGRGGRQPLRAGAVHGACRSARRCLAARPRAPAGSVDPAPPERLSRLPHRTRSR